MKSVLKIALALLLFSGNFRAQTTTANPDKNLLIQFSGRVLDQDSLTPIPFVSIGVKGTKRYYASDFNGFFSAIVSPGDVLEFHSIVHKDRSYKIEDTLRHKYYFAIQLLARDTFQLDEVDIYPWPSKDEFKKAFLALNLNETDGDRADKNLSRDEMSYLERNSPASAALNYKYVMQAYYTKVYTAGQQPMNTLLNPVNWAQFIDAWRKGKLSSNSKKKK